MVAWSVELLVFDIQYEPHDAMKTKFMTKFLVEFAGNNQTTPDWWNLYVDGASNVKGSAAKIILEGPDHVTLDQAIKAEYELLIAGLKLAIEVRAKKLRCYIDSQLVQG